MADIDEVARTIEYLTGIPPRPREPIPRMARRERRSQAERVRSFRALSPELQEGALRYAERIRASYQP
jgi:hypothetical protein